MKIYTMILYDISRFNQIRIQFEFNLTFNLMKSNLD